MKRVLPLILAFLSAQAQAQDPKPPAPHYGLDFVNVDSECAESILLPEPEGPHQVGNVTYHWIDQEREEAMTGDPHDLRQIIVQLFYPAQRVGDGSPVAYVPELDAMRSGFRADSRETPQQIAKDLALYSCVVTYAYPEAAVDVLRAAYPLLLFSPGGNMSRHWHTALAQELASQGYVVAVMSHPYSGMDVFPAGGLHMSSPYWNAPDDATPEEQAQLREELTDLLAADARFVLHRLTELNEADPVGRFTGRFDFDRVAILGHSRGGKTVGRACSSDDRFRACVIYDNIGPDPEREAGLRQPQMTMRRPWPEERTQVLHHFLSNNTATAYDVVVEGASHFSFSDLPVVDREHYESEIAPERAHRIVSDYTLAFLGKYLHDRPAPLLDDPAARPVGVTVRVFQP